MEKKAVSQIILTLLLISMLTLAFNIQLAKSEPMTIIVPDDYEKIQWAVGNASDGDTIFVRAGIYLEHVVVNKSLSLIGEDKSTTVIDGGGDEAYGPYEYGYVVKVAANCVNITGFTIRNSRQTGRGAGLYLKLANHCNVSGNNLINNFNGIQLDYSSHNIVTANIASSNIMRGIVLFESSNNNIIANNNVTSNDDGSEILHCSNNTITENIFSSNNIDGILLYASGGVTSNNTLTRNVFSYNGGSGIALYYSNSSNNVIFHNSFINNGIQASTWEAVNVWNDGYPSGGNYWSDYGGFDSYTGPYQNETGSDGIGDTPYIIDGNNQDNYPLMEPWSLKPPSPVEATKELIETIETWNLSKGIENSLTSKLDNVVHQLNKVNDNVAINKLTALINQVEALRGKKLTTEQANYLIAEAQRIIDLING